MRLLEERKKKQIEYEEKIKNYIRSNSSWPSDNYSWKQSAGSWKGFQKNPFNRPMSGKKHIDEKDQTFVTTMGTKQRMMDIDS